MTIEDAFLKAQRETVLMTGKIPAGAIPLSSEAEKFFADELVKDRLRKAAEPSQVTKQDAGKPDFTIVLGPMQKALLEMVKVRMFGNEKYSRIARENGVPFDPESWRKNSPQRYIASATRHLLKVIVGERQNDDDGGVNHIAQAMVDLGFALELELAEQEKSK